MKNSETLKDAVIDFEGTNHLKQRKHGELHRLFIGRDKLRVDANGKSVDFTEETHHLFQLFGKFTAGGSQVLLGACNANKCISVVAQTSKDMNAVIYGHNSYSYSMSLNTGRFYGGWWNQYPSVVDGNQGGLGHYFRIGPDGKINFDVGGVKFLASPTQNGMADLKISPDPEYPPKKQ